MISIIDFTRRNDPACKEAVELLEKKMKNVPDVFTFWSKNPNGIYNLYHKHIDLLQKHNCLVLGMFTITGYDNKIEPGIDKKLFHKLDNIINLLGDPDKIKLRFDELGCKKVILYVKDLDNNKLDKKVIYFKVNDALPILKDLKMYFPQY